MFWFFLLCYYMYMVYCNSSFSREVMQAKVEYKMKEREMHNASKNWNFDIENTDIGRVRIKLQRLMQKKMDGNPTFRARVDLFQEALKEGKLKSVFNDKRDRAKEREKILQRRMSKREIIQESEDQPKLKLDLGIVTEEADETKSGTGSRRSSTRPASGAQKSVEGSESIPNNTNRVSQSVSRPTTGRPGSTKRPGSSHQGTGNSSRPGSSTQTRTGSTSRPASSTQRDTGNSCRETGNSSRPSSSGVQSGRRDSKTTGSNPNTDRKNGSHANDWKPLNF